MLILEITPLGLVFLITLFFVLILLFLVKRRPSKKHGREISFVEKKMMSEEDIIDERKIGMYKLSELTKKMDPKLIPDYMLRKVHIIFETNNSPKILKLLIQIWSLETRASIQEKTVLENFRASLRANLNHSSFEKWCKHNKIERSQKRVFAKFLCIDTSQKIYAT